MNNKSLVNYSDGTDTLTGVLFNGDVLSTTFDDFDGGTINLNIGAPPAAAPEPSPFAVFAVGLLGLGTLAVKAGKRRAA